MFHSGVDSMVLGGIHQENDYNVNVCPDDKQAITNGCRNFLPAVQNAEHLFDWVGLRPGRKEVRLELETTDKEININTADNIEHSIYYLGNHKILIHNYKHGGSGVTLAWGCATDVVQLLSNAIKLKSERKQ